MCVVISAASLGPYIGHHVSREQIDGGEHNEWLWEVCQQKQQINISILYSSIILYCASVASQSSGGLMSFVIGGKSELAVFCCYTNTHVY